jgi:tetratricopeptide (TPR) repeat protein
LFTFPDDYLAIPTVDKDRIPVGSVDATATAYARRPTATPRSLDSYMSAGDALFAAGRYSYAIEQYTDALARSPRDATIYYRRGLAYQHNQQLTAALDDFNRALELDAALRAVYRERGLLFLTINETAQNNTHLEAARQDFARYEALGGDMQQPDMVAALNQLNSTSEE